MATAAHINLTTGAVTIEPCEPAVPTIPEEIPMHRAKKAMVINGWMDAVNAAIDAIENPISRACTRIEFDTAPNLVRQGATTLAVMAAIGMSETQRDEMILLAVTLP